MEETFNWNCEGRLKEASMVEEIDDNDEKPLELGIKKT